MSHGQTPEADVFNLYSAMASELFDDCDSLHDVIRAAIHTDPVECVAGSEANLLFDRPTDDEETMGSRRFAVTQGAGAKWDDKVTRGGPHSSDSSAAELRWILDC